MIEGANLKPLIIIVYSSIIIKLKLNNDTSEKLVPVEVEICEGKGYCIHTFMLCNLHLMLILKTAGQQLERWRDVILCLPLLFNYSLLYHK